MSVGQNVFSDNAAEQIIDATRLVQASQKNEAGELAPGGLSPVLVQITALTSDSAYTTGYYDAVEVKRSGINTYWTNSLRAFGGAGTLPPLGEINGSNSVPENFVTTAFPTYKSDGTILWKFVGPVTMVPVVVAAKVAYNKYTVSVYGNGRYDDAGSDQPATLTGKTLWIYDIASSETIPAGTWLMAVRVNTHYEGQVPIWL